MTFQPPVTSAQRGTRNPVTKLVVPALSFLCGASGSEAPDRAVVVSNWMQVQPGGICNLTLHVSQLAGTVNGTLDVTIETATNPFDAVTNPRGNVNESPRPLLQQFDSVAGTILPDEAVYESSLTAPNDGWIRVTVTPGQSAGQLCNWQITGNCFHAGTCNPV
jgi:hypothetical protein